MGERFLVKRAFPLVAAFLTLTLFGFYSPALANSNDFSSPTIVGEAVVGIELKANSPRETGRSRSRVISWQWLECSQPLSYLNSYPPIFCREISGATQSRFVPTDAEFNQWLAVKVEFLSSGQQVTRTSKTTRTKVERSPLVTVLPSLTGRSVVGETLTANRGSFLALPQPVQTGHWISCDTEFDAFIGGVPNSCSPIESATRFKYRPRDADIGKYLAFATFLKNRHGEISAVTSSVEVTERLSLSIQPGTKLAAGFDFTCAALRSGKVSCWGGILNPASSTPQLVEGLQHVESISAAGSHICALDQQGFVYCWGANYYGQLGLGSTEYSTYPQKVEGLKNVVAISAGIGRTCAVLRSGQVACWGLADNATLASQINTRPAIVPGLESAISVASGVTHSCALLVSGGIKCWGSNGSGELGNGTNTPSLRPTKALGIENATQISSGGSFTCAALQSGRAMCWGDNYYGRLGNGTVEDTNIPTMVVGLTGVRSISAGWWHTCAQAQGYKFCWGRNTSGQLGDGSWTNSTVPVALYTDMNVMKVVAGMDHTCVIEVHGYVYCWGSSYAGKRGEGESGVVWPWGNFVVNLDPIWPF